MAESASGCGAEGDRNCTLQFGVSPNPFLGGRFGYFLFFLHGEGEGGVRGVGRGGVRFLLKIPGGGEGFLQDGKGLRGWEGVCGELGNLGGGWPKCPPSFFHAAEVPKGPFHTKNAMALETVVFCYCRSVLLCMPICCHFSQEKQCLQTLRRSESLWP